MKKIALLFIFAVSAFAANAQYTLTGTSYTQNFDALTTGGIPTGWRLYNGATSTSLGTIDATYSNSTTWGAYWDTLGCPSDVFGHGFKNSASADNGPLASMLTCTLQEGMPNRCLSVRQASNTTYPGFDPGPSFAFQIANTTGLSGFNLSFNLQSLDSSCPRVTTWTVDYGLGATPTTFVPLTTSPAVLTTGNRTFTNQAVTATLPAAVNNQSQPVWIRISTLSATTGSGARTTSGIDDFNLTWGGSSSTGISNVSASGNMSLEVVGFATSSAINFNCSTEEAGQYTLTLCDMTGRSVYSENIQLAAGSQAHTVNTNLATGLYIARISNGKSLATAKVSVR